MNNNSRNDKANSEDEKENRKNKESKNNSKDESKDEVICLMISKEKKEGEDDVIKEFLNGEDKPRGIKMNLNAIDEKDPNKVLIELGYKLDCLDDSYIPTQGVETLKYDGKMENDESSYPLSIKWS